MRKSIASFFMLLMLLSITSPVLACKPEPPDDPRPKTKYLRCSDLGSGYRFGFAVRYANNGTYAFTSSNGVLDGGAPQDPGNAVTILNSSGRSFDWTSTMGIDAVIVYAGGTSTVKKLNEATSGQNYYGRLERPSKPYKVEGVNFCYDYELTVSTTAKGTMTGAAAWEITKTVDTPSQAKFAGETAEFAYTVAVNGTAGTATAGKVVTTTTIKNDTPVKTRLAAVKGYMPQYRKTLNMNCGVRMPYTLKPGEELTCSTTRSVSKQRDGESVVNVSTSGGAAGGTSTGKIAWSGAVAGGGTVGPVTVTDTNAAFGGPYTVSASQSWNYTVSLPCPTDPAAYVNGVYTTTLDNTAAITETNQQASQSVALTCYAPTVSVTTAAAYDALYTWGITKTSPITSLDMTQSQVEDVDYTVSVSVVDRVTSNYSVSGDIVLGNPHPTADMVVTVASEVAPGVPVVLEGCANPLTIPAGQAVTCSYSAESEGALEGAGALRVTLNDIVFPAEAPFDFSNAVVNETDECVEVFDDAFAAPLGSACADTAPAAFNYTVQVGPFGDYCGDTDYTNTAYFIANDTQASDFANWQVLIDVACGVLTNCTYNSVYWIAHADPDPSIYDASWDRAGGPNAAFFDTGSTWIAVLSAETVDGDVYQRLAKNYMVARLNVYHGAQASASFLATLDHAASLLNQYDTNRAGITGAVTGDFSNTNLTLSNFNKGLIGPGVCPDCTADD